MKQFRQLIKELHSKKVVFTECRFQPPSAGHELLVNAVKKIAETHHADHIVFASNSEDKKDVPLIAERKVYYLKRMFPNINFAEESTDIAKTAMGLSKKYKDLTFVTSSDKVAKYKKIFDEQHLEITIISTGERDSASGMTSVKMKESAKQGDFESFKKGLPHTLTELDGKRLMNEMRQGMGMEILKEHVKFKTDEIREKYFAGEIFHVNDIVESNGVAYKIVKRGSNHLLVEDQQGNKFSKWPQDLEMSSKEFKIIEEDIDMGNEGDGLTDLKDKDIDDMISGMSDDDYLDAYEDHELSLVDKDSGEYLHDIKEEVLNEVLSRMERIRAKIRFARTEAKRERKIAIALKMRSNTATLNKRARKLAIVMMKKRLAKKPLDKLSVAEKERLEATIAKRKKIIDRIAMRLVPKVKKIESDRLTHKQYTK